MCQCLCVCAHGSWPHQTESRDLLCHYFTITRTIRRNSKCWTCWKVLQICLAAVVLSHALYKPVGAPCSDGWMMRAWDTPPALGFPTIFFFCFVALLNDTPASATMEIFQAVITLCNFHLNFFSIDCYIKNKANIRFLILHLNYFDFVVKFFLIRSYYIWRLKLLLKLLLIICKWRF